MSRQVTVARMVLEDCKATSGSIKKPAKAVAIPEMLCSCLGGLFLWLNCYRVRDTLGKLFAQTRNFLKYECQQTEHSIGPGVVQCYLQVQCISCAA